MSWSFQRERADTEDLDNIVLNALGTGDNDLKTARHSKEIMRVRGWCITADSAATDYRFYSKNTSTSAKTYLSGKITLAAAGGGGPVVDAPSGWFETNAGETFGIEVGASAISGHVKIQYLP